MHSLVKCPSTMYKTLPHEQTPHTIVIHESFLLYFIPKFVDRLQEAEAPCFMKNASASGSLKSQMLQSPLPASFFKVLPLPQKFNRFRFCFYIPGANTPLISKNPKFFASKSVDVRM